jgi:hypothetical protein
MADFDAYRATRASTEPQAGLGHTASVTAKEEARGSTWNTFLDSLCKPTPAMLWLERAAKQLNSESSRDGSASNKPLPRNSND